jgi:hypothetical protein
MSNLAVSNIKFISSTGAFTDSSGSVSYLSYNSATGYVGVNGIVFPTGTQIKAVNTVNDIISTTPSSGQALVWSGTAWTPTTINVTGRLLSMNVFTTETGQAYARNQSGGSYTWTRPSGCNNIMVYVTGGGGGGRGNDNAYRGAGGGGGATAIKWIANITDATVAVTVGGGGNEARNGGRGATGGTSSFGAYCSATGGEGGQTDSPYEGGIGGSATGGDMNIPGGGGEMCHDSNREGGGGMSFWHKAGSNHHYTDSSRWFIMHGRWGSGGSGISYYTQNDSSYIRGGGGVVIVYNYS